MCFTFLYGGEYMRLSKINTKITDEYLKKVLKVYTLIVKEVKLNH